MVGILDFLSEFHIKLNHHCNIINKFLQGRVEISLLHYFYIKQDNPRSFCSIFVIGVKRYTLKMTTANKDFSRMKIVKELSNDNILQYLQELVRITNKTVIQWNCCQNIERSKGSPGQEI